MTIKTAVFRCDGGPKIGNGHIMRSFVLAKKLSEKNIKCYFLLKKYNLFLKNYIKSDFKILFIKKDTIFKNIPNQIKVGHYHSWVIDEKTLPICFEVTSKNEDGIIMSIRHKEYDLKGVQFHPESILTEYGLLMIKNWIQS